MPPVSQGTMPAPRSIEAARFESVTLAETLSVSPPHKRRPVNHDEIAVRALRTMWDEDDKPGTYLPSLEVIAAECAAIRADWDEIEFYHRTTMLPWVTSGKKEGATRRLRRRWSVPLASGIEGTVHQ